MVGSDAMAQMITGFPSCLVVPALHLVISIVPAAVKPIGGLQMKSPPNPGEPSSDWQPATLVPLRKSSAGSTALRRPRLVFVASKIEPLGYGKTSIICKIMRFMSGNPYTPNPIPYTQAIPQANLPEFTIFTKCFVFQKKLSLLFFSCWVA